MKTLANAINNETSWGILPDFAQYKKLGSSAVTQATNLSIKKALKAINVALEQDGGRTISAPELAFELSAAGFSKFCIDAIDLVFGNSALVGPSDGNDINLVWGKLDDAGRRRWQISAFIRSFEWKYRAEIAAAKAKRAAARKAKADAKADAAAVQLKFMENQLTQFLGRALKDEERAQLAAEAKKQAAELTKTTKAKTAAAATKKTPAKLSAAC